MVSSIECSSKIRNKFLKLVDLQNSIKNLVEHCHIALTILAKGSIIDIWLSSNYTSYLILRKQIHKNTCMSLKTDNDILVKADFQRKNLGNMFKVNY